MASIPVDRPRCRDFLDCSNVIPTVLAYGMGVDSAALLVELVARRTPPDLVLTADPGAEKPETYVYQQMMAEWMAVHGIRHEVVRYTPQRLKHWPPYSTILENVLTDAKLPSISLGRHSCSLKWKVAPQDRFLKPMPPVQAAWARGHRVVRLIGYDASPADTRRNAHTASIGNDLFECRTPLRDWGWNRARCIARIEARSAPRLRTVEGLWRTSTRTRPGRMTDFIRDEGLLPSVTIAAIIGEAPTGLIRFQDAVAHVPPPHRPAMSEWRARFNDACGRWHSGDRVQCARDCCSI